VTKKESERLTKSDFNLKENRMTERERREDN